MEDKKKLLNKLKDLKLEYFLEFDDGFPTFMLGEYSVAEKIELIEQCLKDKKPIQKYIDLNLDDDVIY